MSYTSVQCSDGVQRPVWHVKKWVGGVPCRHCGIRFDYPGQTTSAGECNIHSVGVCNVIGHKYFETCCTCLRRMGVSESIWNTYGCNSCKVRWGNMTDEEKTPIQPPGCCQIM
jgi:hypothetical protein